MRQQQQRRNNGGTAKVQNVDKRTNKISFAAPRKLRACSMYVSAKCTTCIVRASKCVSERASVCLCAAQMLAQCSSVCVSMPLTSSERETNASYKISTKRDAKGRRRGVGSTKRAERAALLFAQHKRSHGCQCSPTCTTHLHHPRPRSDVVKLCKRFREARRKILSKATASGQRNGSGRVGAEGWDTRLKTLNEVYESDKVF